jgi:hypothetical protein
MQYARQLYADKAMAERLEPCRSLIISDTNLQLIGTRFSYDDYKKFYEEIFVPMKVSQEKLLIEPDETEFPDIEEVGTQEEQPAEETDDLFPEETKKAKVQDFDFGDDFW